MSRKKSNQATAQRAKQPSGSQKTKTTKRRGARPSMGPQRALAVKKHTQAACSVLDPFCIHAKGARRPDGLSTNTIPLQVKGTITLTTNASGDAASLFIPAGGKYRGAQAAVAAGNLTFAANWAGTPQLTFLTTNAAEVRIVSWGVKVLSVASMTNCQGLLHMFNVTAPVNGLVIPQGSLINTEDITVPLTSGLERTWLSKPLGSKAHAFVQSASINDTYSDMDWTSLVVEIQGGAPSTVAIICEYVYNIEFQLTQAGVSTTGLGNLNQGVSRPANPVALQVQNVVQTQIPSFINGGIEAAGKKIESAAASAVSSFLDSAADFGLGLLFG